MNIIVFLSPSVMLLHTPFSEFSEANHFVAKNGVLSLLWMGGMDWWPNREGLQWFLKYVWPLLNRCERQFQLSLIGKGTQQLGSLCTGNISAHGFVPDPVSYLHQADLLIVPIFSGAGIRIKALEALSHSVPCLGTPVGLSGIPLEGCWIGKSCEAWLDILHHLTPVMCKNKGRDGQLTVQQKHCTQTIGKNLDKLLSKLVRDQKSLNND